MQLLRLEMKGFKSFADKTIINFSPGMSAIVGPNGSGKSNITEAIRWVLGESNIRQLRGQKAEDIIFSGTEKRKPLGAAEVTLVFDNSDGKLSHELSEVAISRRIYRNGDSEFSINKRNCRLKDIHHLLADTGLGRDSMAIIGQNRVDAVLNSKPEERRLIFEDVAGISKFKLNKEDALRRIAATERNMERLQDLLVTLEEQLEPLAEKAEKAKAYFALEKEKRIIDAALLTHQFKNAERLLTRLENEGIALQEEANSWEHELSLMEKQLQGLHNQLSSGQQLLQQMEGVFSERQRLAERSRGQLDVLKEQQHNSDRELTLLQERLNDLEKTIQAEEKSILFLQSLLKKDEAQIVEQTQQWKSEDTAYEEMSKAVEIKQHELLELQTKIQIEQRKELTRISELEAKKQRLLHLKEQEKDKQQSNIELEREIVEERGHVQELEDLYGQKKIEEHELETQLKNFYDDFTKIVQEINAWRKELICIENELRQKSGRLELLETWTANYEGFGETTKAILKAKEAWRKDVVDAVGNLFEADSKYMVAIEMSLGNAVNHIVMTSTNGASQAMQYLKEKQLGRATFLPLPTVLGKRSTGEALQENGVCGLLVDFLRCKEDHKKIFDYLLGRIILVDTLENGLRIQKKYNQRLRLVTLSGEQLQPGGALVGGSYKKKKLSFLDQKNEKNNLHTIIKTLTQKEAEIISTLEKTESWHDELQSKVKQHEERLQKEKMEILTCESKLQVAKERQKRKEETKAIVISKLSDIASEILQIETLIADLLKENNDNAALVELGKTIQNLQNELQIMESDKQQVYEKMTVFRLQVERLATEKERKIQDISTKQIHCEDEKNKKTPLEKEIQSLCEKLTDVLPQRVVEEQELLENLLEEIETLEKDKNEAYIKHQGIQASITSLTTEQGERQQRFQLVQRKLLEMEGRLTTYRLDVERSLQELHNLGFTKEEALQIYVEGSVKEWKEKILEVQAKIEMLGPINPQAVSEYEEATERHRFLEEQNQDLHNAKKQLEKVIAELNLAMSKKFMEMFAEVSKHFQDIFARLFGGGVAQLVLTDEKDILQGGVELYIQPPGKKRQALPLLSGGERALTVIALLFSFLAYRTAPFCVLDEVDAALDEANVERFGHYLQSLTSETQFIVVSHRKKTMEVAQVLQGVTMVERGVSKLLTVSFNDMEDEV